MIMITLIIIVVAIFIWYRYCWVFTPPLLPYIVLVSTLENGNFLIIAFRVIFMNSFTLQPPKKSAAEEGAKATAPPQGSKKSGSKRKKVSATGKNKPNKRRNSVCFAVLSCDDKTIHATRAVFCVLLMYMKSQRSLLRKR